MKLGQNSRIGNALVCALALVALTTNAFGSETVWTSKPATTPTGPRVTLNFDADWRFLKDDAPGAERPEFDDSAWRRLDVPHDWSIEGPFSQTNATGPGGGFLPAGTGWYRKHFSLPTRYTGKRVFIEFDGVMANSDVWINGHHLGHRPYGYVSFGYELTGHLNFGDTPNVLAVRVDNSKQPASRWYTGAGIYRHVRLVITDPVHIVRWGVFVLTPEVKPDRATVEVRTTVVNQSASARKVTVHNHVIAPGVRRAEPAPAQTEQTVPGQTIAAGDSAELTARLIVDAPRLWSVDEPNMYKLVTRVFTEPAAAGGSEPELVDEVITPFGIRQFEFRPDTGFWLNGKNLKIKGVCLHHDGSAFGAAVPLSIWERRLRKLRELGVNAVRTAHNPPAPEFLDLCDRLGFLVMNEFFDCWTMGKNPYDYHLHFDEWSKIDVRDTVRRDRNHPCIILWSIGNEIRDTVNPEIAIAIARDLVGVCHENDPSRPVTQALFRPNVTGDYTNGLADLLDVVGTNYRDNELLAAQRAKPWWKIIGTEQRHDRQTWLWLRDNPSHSGQFLWTGVDYLGEAWRWPIVAAGSGLLDRTGKPRPLAYQRQSWWSNKPVVYAARRVAPERKLDVDPGFVPLLPIKFLFADWAPATLEPHEEEVEVYSNCEQVELLLNGRLLGVQWLPYDEAPRIWKVRFEPGVLKVVGRNRGRVVAQHELRTAGKPAQILLTADRPQVAHCWDDVCVVTATVVDSKGVVVPGATNLISFDIAGPGVIAAVDSADNTSHEPFHATHRRAFQGSCVALVKATAPCGKITVKATAPGLRPGSVTIRAVKPRAE